jgi:hypothetical protein
MAEIPFEDGIRVYTKLTHPNNFAPKIARDQNAQQNEEEFVIPLTLLRVHDAYATVLTGTANNDDLALVGGTLGTNAPSIQAGDLKAAGATTRYARFDFGLPPNYVAGQTVKLRYSAGMITTAADGTCTLDMEFYKSDEDNTVSATDLCSDVAQSMNDTSFADLDFEITATSLNPGDMFDVRIAIACNDGASGTDVIPCIGAIKLVCDTRG